VKRSRGSPCCSLGSYFSFEHEGLELHLQQSSFVVTNRIVVGGGTELCYQRRLRVQFIRYTHQCWLGSPKSSVCCLVRKQIPIFVDYFVLGLHQCPWRVSEASVQSIISSQGHLNETSSNVLCLLRHREPALKKNILGCLLPVKLNFNAKLCLWEV